MGRFDDGLFIELSGQLRQSFSTDFISRRLVEFLLDRTLIINEQNRPRPDELLSELENIYEFRDLLKEDLTVNSVQVSANNYSKLDLNNLIGYEKVPQSQMDSKPHERVFYNPFEFIDPSKTLSEPIIRQTNLVINTHNGNIDLNDLVPENKALLDHFELNKFIFTNNDNLEEIKRNVIDSGIEQLPILHKPSLSVKIERVEELRFEKGFSQTEIVKSDFNTNSILLNLKISETEIAKIESLEEIKLGNYKTRIATSDEFEVIGKGPSFDLLYEQPAEDIQSDSLNNFSPNYSVNQFADLVYTESVDVEDTNLEEGDETVFYLQSLGINFEKELKEEKIERKLENMTKNSGMQLNHLIFRDNSENDRQKEENAKASRVSLGDFLKKSIGRKPESSVELENKDNRVVRQDDQIEVEDISDLKETNKINDNFNKQQISNICLDKTSPPNNYPPLYVQPKDVLEYKTETSQSNNYPQLYTQTLADKEPKTEIFNVLSFNKPQLHNIPNQLVQIAPVEKTHKNEYLEKPTRKSTQSISIFSNRKPVLQEPDKKEPRFSERYVSQVTNILIKSKTKTDKHSSENLEKPETTAKIQEQEILKKETQGEVLVINPTINLHDLISKIQNQVAKNKPKNVLENISVEQINWKLERELLQANSNTQENPNTLIIEPFILTGCGHEHHHEKNNTDPKKNQKEADNDTRLSRQLKFEDVSNQNKNTISKTFEANIEIQANEENSFDLNDLS